MLGDVREASLCWGTLGKLACAGRRKGQDRGADNVGEDDSAIAVHEKENGHFVAITAAHVTRLMCTCVQEAWGRQPDKLPTHSLMVFSDPT